MALQIRTRTTWEVSVNLSILNLILTHFLFLTFLARDLRGLANLKVYFSFVNVSDSLGPSSEHNCHNWSSNIRVGMIMASLCNYTDCVRRVQRLIMQLYRLWWMTLLPRWGMPTRFLEVLLCHNFVIWIWIPTYCICNVCDSDEKALHRILKSKSLCHKTDAICCSILELLVRDIFTMVTF